MRAPIYPLNAAQNIIQDASGLSNYSLYGCVIDMKNIHENLPVVYGTGELLEDSRTDWRTTKLKTIAVSKAFEDTTKYWISRSQRMFECGSFLKFVVDGQGNKRLIGATFCRDRMCPSCQKRRSLVVFHQVKQVCISVQLSFPTMRYLLLTLTVPNVKSNELSKEISHMTKSFDRLMKRAEVKRSTKGYFRALEVTYNGERDDYHPHFHVLVAAPSNYFTKNYIKQSRWLELWRESTKYPNITQVDVRPIKPNPKRKDSTAIESAAAEVGKYSTKPSNYTCKMPSGDYMASKKVVRELAAGIRSKRLIGYGGVLKEHHALLKLQDAEGDSVDLVNISNDSPDIDAVMVQIYRWDIGLRQYVS